jgi:hypothetical protein
LADGAHQYGDGSGGQQRLVSGSSASVWVEKVGREKAPSTKIQAPEKLQTSISKLQSAAQSAQVVVLKFDDSLKFEVWSLQFLWSLDLGAWSFLP